MALFIQDINDYIDSLINQITTQIEHNAGISDARAIELVRTINRHLQNKKNNDFTTYIEVIMSAKIEEKQRKTCTKCAPSTAFFSNKNVVVKTSSFEIVFHKDTRPFRVGGFFY